ncbi:NADH:ubiquinone oxidoreductase [candidate division WOR-1 bacterium RIFOXYA12_FULL_52_29]|uniref:NADH:ubiquinone oxidoreductase n=1 Tax=candidate division WOR-1 bacterium RIFOXYC12_FULL_54_18 TaxID=1802584 RepID=A0A1F4T687_UNCSA|nr:MAG: NADH:ubiquinone oxidoreductase [candidate division WOR-1 bacterium RIFOXYA2_FULL_51_19]OGC17914.1 MAG: NADH:ubiquinone oxidoreductase [candidate division WOR-1 bacterium RIFOXYA12_FULL_52_29]OGC26770.1 MAG: NADH:ubiquinone oxidoreductase [candidate division WOR-1 bacterium RIFOXYB2_FULL_45_9]OGC28331.1 MAG: NADH:ubiquinone oxidoreductase [candidate division WOR-1 bacterium RIFOXYC12_FULL_54_18]OGC31213.1 MAG: NADH:ubiquinone oxidoreductase [candidate division WOR-1 bacterium RIFOXYB12_F
MAKENIIPIGPFHPLLEEPEFFKFYVEGETVIDADVRVGYNHRGVEKLLESKTYDQGVFLVERICGICSTSHPFAFTQAVEDISGIEVPERAKYIRMIIGELERIHSHLLWVGLAGHFIGYNTVFMWAWKYREPVLDMFEAISGNRNHYNMFKVGGVRRDIKDDDVPGLLKAIDEVEKFTSMLAKSVSEDPIIQARTKNIGTLKKQDAIDLGVVGPVARGSGLAIDNRKDFPYANYREVEFEKIVLEQGDVYSRAVVRLLEIIESVKIIRQSLKKLSAGPIETEVREIGIGEGIGLHEAPRGEVFHYSRSNGSNYPERHKIRAPSFMNVPSFKKTVIGQKISDAALITAAVDPCYCCTERMAAIDPQNNKTLLTGEELVRLSQERTEEIRRKIRS